MVSTRSFVLGMICVHVASAMRVGSWLRKRDAAPFVPQRLNIPLNFDPRGRPVTTVIMSPGDGQQQFNLTMSTGTGLTYVAGVQCATCSGTPLYNQTESTTAQAISSADSVPLFGQSTGASVIKESCQLRQQNGSAWAYPNQTIVVLNQQATSQLETAAHAQIGSDLSGLIGLGTNRGSLSNSSGFSANFNDSIMGQFFIRNPTAVNFTFGMMLNTPLNVPRGSNAASSPVAGAGSSAGVLHWLQPDPSAYDTTQVSWVTANNNDADGFVTYPNTTGSGDWFVGLDGWVMSSGNNRLSNPMGVVATVDPLYTEMYLPTDQARLIHDAIPNSTLRTDLSSLGPLSQAWSIPCSSSFTFGIVAGSQTFTLTPNTLIVQLSDGTCVSAIEGWTDTTVTTYLFGSRFLSTIYLVFNIPKDGLNQVGFAPRSTSHSSSHVGAIVGGVVGGVAFVVLVALAAFFFYYRHRTQAHRVTAAQYDHAEIEKPSEGDVQPYTLGSPTRVQLIHGPPSTAGSSGFSPAGSSFSPVGSVGLSGFGMHGDDQGVDIAPPSYQEASEGSPRLSHGRTAFPDEKGDNRASQLSESSQSQSILPSPLHPVDENGPSASGSETIWE